MKINENSISINFSGKIKTLKKISQKYYTKIFLNPIKQSAIEHTFFSIIFTYFSMFAYIDAYILFYFWECCTHSLNLTFFSSSKLWNTSDTRYFLTIFFAIIHTRDKCLREQNVSHLSKTPKREKILCSKWETRK